MNQSSTNLMVAVFERVVCVKVNGRADFTSSLDLKKLIQELARRGCHRFVFELRGCVAMDSTFLGTLCNLSLDLNETPRPQNTPLELFNPNPRIVETLENLGVADLFKIISCPESLPGQYEPVAGTAGQDKAALTRNCLEAHNILMALNPENVHKFKDVARFLAEDLHRLEGGEEKT